MIGNDVKNALLSGTYIEALVHDLVQEGADVGKIAHDAIDQLQKIDTINTPLNLRKIAELDIQPEIKQKLAEALTHVFIGSYCKGRDKEQLDKEIANLFSQKALSAVSETVELTSKFLIMQKQGVEEPLIERFLKEKELDELVSQLAEKLPPETKIQEIVKICDTFLNHDMAPILRQTVDLIPSAFLSASLTCKHPLSRVGGSGGAS